MTKYCKATIQVKFLYRDNKCFQYFIVADTKYKKYLLDSRYAMNALFEKRIQENALSNLDEHYTFVNRRDEEDRITLEFSVNGEVQKRLTGYFAIVGDIPCSDGCEECRFRNETFCMKKEKELEKMLKTCKFFTQALENK